MREEVRDFRPYNWPLIFCLLTKNVLLILRGQFLLLIYYFYLKLLSVEHIHVLILLLGGDHLCL